MAINYGRQMPELHKLLKDKNDSCSWSTLSGLLYYSGADGRGTREAMIDFCQWVLGWATKGLASANYEGRMYHTFLFGGPIQSSQYAGYSRPFADFIVEHNLGTVTFSHQTMNTLYKGKVAQVFAWTPDIQAIQRWFLAQGVADVPPRRKVGMKKDAYGYDYEENPIYEYHITDYGQNADGCTWTRFAAADSIKNEQFPLILCRGMAGYDESWLSKPEYANRPWSFAPYHMYVWSNNFDNNGNNGQAAGNLEARAKWMEFLDSKNGWGKLTKSHILRNPNAPDKMCQIYFWTPDPKLLCEWFHEETKAKQIESLVYKPLHEAHPELELGITHFRKDEPLALVKVGRRRKMRDVRGRFSQKEG